MNPTSIVTVPIITALIQIAKGLGLPTQYAALSSLLLGVLLSLATHLATQPPAGTELWQAALSGLIQGLSASGLYSAASSLTSSKPPDRSSGTLDPTGAPQ